MRRLNSVKFVWKPNGSIPWMEMYQKLVAYKTQHKSTNVPFKYKKDPKLGSWANTQRWKFKNNELSEERINHLESISFVWSDVQWTAMYHKLAEYKRQHHGSTLVPLGYTEDPFLGRWVYNQRYAYNKGNLLGKRLKLLNAINFVWSLKNNASS
ncbi:hypothetical protein FRACYDRAFT_269474 [Fragilariopsis cylindrus CCMP1102]|uniref:Helicase-associated domain-containing protein n=1 Tax=Fragilariopsis cylindrus CCMP1102 TaxID=635003 RepID=A0A1E7FCG8_9STRA|nr:hypothetical protein FRACYDRAFT_269474 [Fragilariopsis cylindrus CCMP1102]|eukprot:OEU15745.1 hypothetical protein FRACYDRAFT_269474 [Fragilariopsis cylindrus CCMP1102]